MERTCFNTELSIKDEGRKVVLVGWASKRRNLGQLLFIDLRDRSGIIQITVKDGVEVPDIRNEYVIQVFGTVGKKDIPNKNLKTGEIEIIADKIVVVNKAKQPPLIIDDNTDALEDTRLKYRYLDLRRPIMQHFQDVRHKIKMSVHNYLNDLHFIEVETPMLCASSPEGAKEYLVPSRLHHGHFYALPQSPQMFKQLLMVGGFERYYQIARCFRDEDLRADRQPDFTQIDIETSFLDQEQFLTMMEGLIQNIFKNTINHDLPAPFKRITYWDAINLYGSDKPDTRFDMKLVDIKDIFVNTEFEGFKGVEDIRALKVENIADKTSRKVIDKLASNAKQFSLGGAIVLKVTEGELTGSFTKWLSDTEKAGLKAALDFHDNDIIIIAAGVHTRTTAFLGATRSNYGHELNLIDESKFDVLWVVDFPMFELDDEGKLTCTHHPFTRVKDEDIAKLDTAPLEVSSYAFDLVMNGYELSSGSLRNYDQEMQEKIFEMLGLTEEDIQNKFGFFVEALKYGTPPHGGMGIGLERLTMILSGTNNIRDVVAFPKNLSGVCPMSNAPTLSDDERLAELGIKIADYDETK